MMPMTGHVARSSRRRVGGTAARQTPTYIRSMGSALDEVHRDYLRRKLHRMVEKFGSAIERTSVRLEDVNGPRGGVDKRCQVKIVLRGLPSVYVDERDSSVQAAMDRSSRSGQSRGSSGLAATPQAPPSPEHFYISELK